MMMVSSCKSRFEFRHLRMFLVPVGIILIKGVISTNIKNGEPEFAEPVPNVTVAIGQDAFLPCLVRNLRHYKVGWFQVEKKQVLTIHKSVITRNYRIKLVYTEPHKWILQVENVQPTDRGHYMCQINTIPMKSEVGYLDVHVPPDIKEEETSADVVADEGSDVELKCKATGYPEPIITWQREDQKMITLTRKGHQKVQKKEFQGEVLEIRHVSRTHSGGYLCIAYNGIPPPVSRRIALNVNFAPMLWTPKQVQSEAIGHSATLTCQVESYPLAQNVWLDGNSVIITNNNRTQVTIRTKGYNTKMKLKIKNLRKSDFGLYQCKSSNIYGNAEGFVRLFEKKIVTQPPTTEFNYAYYDSEEYENEAGKNPLNERPAVTHETLTRGKPSEPAQIIRAKTESPKTGRGNEYDIVKTIRETKTKRNGCRAMTSSLAFIDFFAILLMVL